MLITVQSYAIKKDPSYRDARKNGAMAKMELRITNDMGVPIPNASVHVLMGMNFRERSYDIDGKSDMNGLFVVEGNTTGNEIIIEVTKDRYYKSSQKISFITMGRAISNYNYRSPTFGWQA